MQSQFSFLSYGNKKRDAAGKTLKKTKITIITETEEVRVTLPLASPPVHVYSVCSPLTEENFPHSTFTQRSKMKRQSKQTLKMI